MAPLVIGLLTGLAEVEKRNDPGEDARVRRAQKEDRRESGWTTTTGAGQEGPHPQTAGRGAHTRKIKTLTGVSLSAVQRTCAESQVA